MSFLRFVALLALAFWIGGLAALGTGATTIFSVLEAHDAVTGRDTAALVFGQVFDQFLRYTWIAGVLLLASLATRAALGPRPRRMAIRVWTATAMLIAGVATSVILVPRINSLRDAATRRGQPIANLPATDPERITFGRLHALSGLMMLLTITAGAGLTWAEMKDTQ
jgi:hypothetical protein